MGDKTNIEWADATWNPIVGCSIVSPGCTNCYAMKQADRIPRMSGGASHYFGMTKIVNSKPVWTGKVALAPEGILAAPLRWRRPRRIFVNSMGDLFHESVHEEDIDDVFAIMSLGHWHTYQALTKRSARMRRYFSDANLAERIGRAAARVGRNLPDNHRAWSRGTGPWRLSPAGKAVPLLPLPNVWLGVSAEDQTRADERIPDLLATPAAVRFVSAEPLLGGINFQALRRYNPSGAPWINALRGLVTRGDYLARSPSEGCLNTRTQVTPPELPRLDWIIVGGESGPGARPMHPDWARSIRDQCAAASIPFFFKQWGEWLPGEDNHGQFGPNPMHAYRRCDDHSYEWPGMHRLGRNVVHNFGTHADPWSGDLRATRVGKRRAGRKLDGVEHNQFPRRAS